MATCLAVARATAQTGDFNGDGLLDCQDIDLLNAELLAATGASQFDLNADGRVDYQDTRRWHAAAGSVQGDANLDGVTIIWT